MKKIVKLKGKKFAENFSVESRSQFCEVKVKDTN